MPFSDRQRILLLEDEPLIAMELHALVEDEGYAVVGPAADCSQALVLLNEHKVDAALLDAIVGDERCDIVAEVLDELKVPWALVTGYDSDELHDHFEAVPMVAKPFDPADISQILRDLLRN